MGKPLRCSKQEIRRLSVGPSTPPHTKTLKHMADSLVTLEALCSFPGKQPRGRTRGTRARVGSKAGPASNREILALSCFNWVGFQVNLIKEDFFHQRERERERI